MICFHEIFAKDHKSKEKRDLNNLAFSRIFWRMEKKGKIKYKWVFNIVNTFTNLRMRKLRSLCVFTKFLHYEKKKNKFKFLSIYFDETFAVLKTTQKAEWFQNVLNMKLEWWYFHEKKNNNFTFFQFSRLNWTTDCCTSSKWEKVYQSPTLWNVFLKPKRAITWKFQELKLSLSQHLEWYPLIILVI